MHSVYSLDLGPCSVAYESLKKTPDQQKKKWYTVRSAPRVLLDNRITKIGRPLKTWIVVEEEEYFMI